MGQFVEQSRGFFAKASHGLDEGQYDNLYFSFFCLSAQAVSRFIDANTGRQKRFTETDIQALLKDRLLRQKQKQTNKTYGLDPYLGLQIDVDIQNLEYAISFWENGGVASRLPTFIYFLSLYDDIGRSKHPDAATHRGIYKNICESLVYNQKFLGGKRNVIEAVLDGIPEQSFSDTVKLVLPTALAVNESFNLGNTRNYSQLFLERIFRVLDNNSTERLSRLIELKPSDEKFKPDELLWVLSLDREYVYDQIYTSPSPQSTKKVYEFLCTAHRDIVGGSKYEIGSSVHPNYFRAMFHFMSIAAIGDRFITHAKLGEKMTGFYNKCLLDLVKTVKIFPENDVKRYLASYNQTRMSVIRENNDSPSRELLVDLIDALIEFNIHLNFPKENSNGGEAKFSEQNRYLQNVLDAFRAYQGFFH